MKELRFVVVLLGLSIAIAQAWTGYIWTNASGGPVSNSVTCPHCGNKASWIEGQRFQCLRCFTRGDVSGASW